ncbi:MAG: TetR/AcrR family transcriptional regulator [Pseudomonadota bacterium]
MRKPHADIRAAALKSAEMIVVEEGLPALNARRVAAEAGCSVGTLYNVFGQLDGLIDAVNLSTLRLLGEEVAASMANLPADARREQRLSTLAQMYLRFARTHRNRWSALFEHRGLGPPDKRQQDVEQLLFGRIVAAAGIDPGAITKAEADSLRMLLAAIHGVVAFTVNRAISTGEAERYVSLIVQAGVRGYREMVEEGLL